MKEAWLVVGRRGGKSFILALIAVFLTTHKTWKPKLQPGKALVHEIKSRIGVSATVRVMPVGGVERSIGKAKRINDLRPKG